MNLFSKSHRKPVLKRAYEIIKNSNFIISMKAAINKAAKEIVSVVIAFASNYIYDLNFGDEIKGRNLRNFWVARIIGESDKFGLKREFITQRRVSSKSKGVFYYLISADLKEDNVYEVMDGKDRFFTTIVGGELNKITRREVVQLIN